MAHPRPDSLAVLASAFADTVSQLQQASELRCADMSRHTRDLDALEAVVLSAEAGLQQIEEAVREERAQFPQAAVLSEALQQQADHLDFINRNLPPFLPAARPQQQASAASASKQAARSSELDKENAGPAQQDGSAGDQQGGTAGAAPVAAAAKQKKTATPRRYITNAELDSVSAYMRNRITLDKVNAAVDDVALLAEATARLLVAARAAPCGLSVQERRHAQVLIRNVASREEVKGRSWFLERDCRGGGGLRLDTTGKSILQILRHLGRLQELHCQVEEGFENVYVLL